MTGQVMTDVLCLFLFVCESGSESFFLYIFESEKYGVCTCICVCASTWAPQCVSACVSLCTYTIPPYISNCMLLCVCVVVLSLDTLISCHSTLLP